MLSWQPVPDDSIESYQYRLIGNDWVTIANSDATTSRVSIPGLPLGNYVFEVRAVNDRGPGNPSNQVLVSVSAGAPAIPASFAVRYDEASDVLFLNWDNPGDGSIIRYEYSIDDGPFTAIPNSDFSTTTARISYDAIGTHRIEIRAINSAGASLPTSAVEFESRGATIPTVPQNLTASPDVFTQMVVYRWTRAAQDFVDGYEYELDGGSWTRIPNSSRSTTQFSLPDGTDGPHTLRLRATSGENRSDPARVDYTVRSPLPAAPAVVSASAFDEPTRTARIFFTAPTNAPITSYQYRIGTGTVSYTHLTLPTICSV